MAGAHGSDTVLHTERVFEQPVARVFGAFEDPALLARWWGPKGFTNTFEVFEFRPGGRWVFVMHGPDGASYPNESIFRDIRRGGDAVVVIEHVVEPRFRLTVKLTARGEGTHLTWDQDFESAAVTAKLRELCTAANEQNLDRLEAVLAGTLPA